jgi:hypothetical protein
MKNPTSLSPVLILAVALGACGSKLSSEQRESANKASAGLFGTLMTSASSAMGSIHTNALHVFGLAQKRNEARRLLKEALEPQSTKGLPAGFCDAFNTPGEVQFDAGCSGTCSGETITIGCEETETHTLACTETGGSSYAVTLSEIAATNVVDMTNATVTNDEVSGTLVLNTSWSAKLTGGEFKGDTLGCTLKITSTGETLPQPSTAAEFCSTYALSCRFRDIPLVCEDIVNSAAIVDCTEGN